MNKEKAKLVAKEWNIFRGIMVSGFTKTNLLKSVICFKLPYYNIIYKHLFSKGLNTYILSNNDIDKTFSFTKTPIPFTFIIEAYYEFHKVKDEDYIPPSIIRKSKKEIEQITKESKQKQNEKIQEICKLIDEYIDYYWTGVDIRKLIDKIKENNSFIREFSLVIGDSDKDLVEKLRRRGYNVKATKQIDL